MLSTKVLTLLHFSLCDICKWNCVTERGETPSHPLWEQRTQRKYRRCILNLVKIIYTLKRLKSFHGFLMFFNHWRPFWMTISFTMRIPGWSTTLMSDHSLVPFAMEMSGKQLKYTPRLCMVTMSSRERNVWMVDHYHKSHPSTTWIERLSSFVFYSRLVSC